MKIACVLGPGFEDSEFKDPYDALRNAGHEVTIVGLEAGAVLAGSTIVLLPTVIIFLAMQRHFLRGVLQGSLKG